MKEIKDMLKFIEERRSTKSYDSSKPVPKELIDKIVEAGLWAASGQNAQAAIVLVVTNKEVRDKISALNAKVLGSSIDPFYGAPNVLIVLGNRNRATYVYDGSLVMGNMMLEAEALGIGNCWIHRAKEVFETPEGKEILKSCGIEGDYEGIGNLIIGYADKEPKTPERKTGRVYYID